MMARSLVKDFHQLQKNISSFSNDEARVVHFQDDLTRFDVELNIKDGFYKDGSFLFEVSPVNYPRQAPSVQCRSRIFHPNIGDGFDHGIVCLNLFDEEWTESMNDLETVVQGLLFLIKNPNVMDALNPLIDSDPEQWDEDLDVDSMAFFASNVRKSLEGGEIEGVVFQRNAGLGPETGGINEVTELVKVTQEKPEGTKEKPEGTQEKPGGTQEKPDATQEKPEGTQEKPEGTQEKPEGTQEKPEGTQEKPEGTQEKPEGTQEKPAGTQEKPEGTQEKPEGTQEKPEGTQEKPEITQEKPEITGESTEKQPEEKEESSTVVPNEVNGLVLTRKYYSGMSGIHM